MELNPRATPLEQPKETNNRPDGRRYPTPLDGQAMKNRTNDKGEKQCYHCKKWGHLMFSCPEREKKADETANPKQAYFSEVCPDVAWNTDSHKYLGRGKVDGKAVRMLVDTGCDRTMVRADVVDEAKWDNSDKSSVLCVHGDTVCYPSAMVDIEKEHRNSQVVLTY